MQYLALITNTRLSLIGRKPWIKTRKGANFGLSWTGETLDKTKKDAKPRTP